MKELTQILKALSDPNRLRIIKMLEIKPLCVCEITSILGLAPSTTSKHLSILKNTHLIFEQKEGKWVNYHLNAATQSAYHSRILPLLRQWLNDESVIKNDSAGVRKTDRNQLCIR